MPDVKCYKCEKVWNYQGESKIFICCSQCHYQIRLDRAITYFQGKEWQKPKRQSSQKIEQTPQLPKAEEQSTPQIPVKKDKSKTEPKSEGKPKSPEIKKFSNLADFNIEVLKRKLAKKSETAEIMQPELPHELFPATGSKICRKHNLPAAYDEGKRKWMCQGCYSDSIKQSESYKKLEKEKKVVPNNQEDKDVVVIEEIKDETEVEVVEYPMPLKDSRGNRLAE